MTEETKMFLTECKNNEECLAFLAANDLLYAENNDKLQSTLLHTIIVNFNNYWSTYDDALDFMELVTYLQNDDFCSYDAPSMTYSHEELVRQLTLIRNKVLNKTYSYQNEDL